MPMCHISGTVPDMHSGLEAAMALMPVAADACTNRAELSAWYTGADGTPKALWKLTRTKTVGAIIRYGRPCCLVTYA